MKKRQVSLKANVWLVSLDFRSGQTFTHYQHRVDLTRLESAIEFINWAREALGDFVPWNVYLAARQYEFEVPAWTIRYLEPGSVFTQIFIRADLVPLVLLHWKEDK